MKKTKLVFGAIVSIVLLIVLFSYVSISEIWNTLKQLPLDVFLIALGIYFLIFLFRAFRFGTLLKGKIKFSKLFSIVCLHNYATLFLPFRAGEAGYVLLVKREGVNYNEGVGTLLIARLFDLISIFLIFFTGYLFFNNPPKIIGTLLIAAFFAVLGLILLIVFLIFLKKKYRALTKIKILLLIQKKIGQVLDSIKEIGFDKKTFLVLIESLVIWMLMFYFAYLVLGNLGINFSLLESVIGSSIGLVLIMLPIQGILGFGTIEGALTIAYMTLGFSRDSIITASFGYHILSLFFAFVFVVYGWVSYNKMKIKA